MNMPICRAIHAEKVIAFNYETAITRNQKSK